MKVLHASIAAIAVPILISGCASSLKTFDSNGNPSVGVPVGMPVLMKITTTTNYKPAMVAMNQVDRVDCLSEVTEEFKILPLGERSYLNFEASPFGKDEFTLEFSDAGVLTKVSLNSDASAGVNAIKGLLDSLLPFVAAPKPAANTEAALKTETAQALKEKSCIKTDTQVTATPFVTPKLAR